jgi:hypothetical protein
LLAQFDSGHAHRAGGGVLHARQPRAAVQRAVRPLAKPVQIVGVLGVRAAANTNRNAAPSTRGHGARTAA